MHIRDFDNTPEDYQVLAHIMNTVWRDPIYTVDDLQRDDAERRPKFAHRRFMAEVDNQVVGYGSFEHNEKFYHPRHFWLRLDVLPDHRQQRIGTALYDYMLAILQTEFNAKELHILTTASRDHSLRFLKKRGFTVGKRDPRSRLDVSNGDWCQFSGLAEKIAAQGITIHALSDLMQADSGALRKVYELHQTLVDDVPEPAEHTRRSFESWVEGYSTAFPYFIPEANFMALHDGDYIGLTSLWGLLNEDTLYTGMSGVKRGYRRKGLAMALKLRAIQYAQAQGTRYIMTSNNSENPMLQINLKLGFEIYDTDIKLVNALSA